jgi:hypothetical protein
MTCNEFRQTLGEEASPNRQLRAAQNDDFHLVPKLRFGNEKKFLIFKAIIWRKGSEPGSPASPESTSKMFCLFATLSCQLAKYSTILER